MSEEILNAIIHLLAIVAKEDEITRAEKASIENFLKENLSNDVAAHYLALFDQMCESLSIEVRSEAEIITETCAKINKEQTAQQKVVVILNLIMLIAADGRISQRERELLYLISDQINIPKKTTDLIKAFVVFQERNQINSSNILVIDDGNQEIPAKCKHMILPGIEGFISILRIPEIEIYLVKRIGEISLILNGAPMRRNHIYNFSTGSVIKSSSAEPVYHSEVVNHFRQIDTKHHLTFVARNLTYKFRNGKVGLRNINIEEESGKLIALMGGSGAGKSTLLNVLNGNETPSEGSVRINGVDIHISKQKIEGVVGYVPQDDLLIEELTVADNLYYAAKLCFKDHSEKQLKELVDKTLQALGLHETRLLKVGSPLDKKISGGQRKRLNIGLELLREPSVLFVDEPTSGLSSRDSENIMDLLKELSLRGKMIFVVIHQPSEDIFKMFDKLVVLDVGGYQVYYGNPIDGIGHFKKIAKIVDQTTTANPEQIFNIIETKVVNEFGNFTNKRKTTPYEWYQHFKEQIKIPSVRETTIIPHKTLHIPNKLKQLAIFTLRDIKTKLGNKQYLTINLLEAPALALLLAFIVRYIPDGSDTYYFSDNLNIPVFFFISVIVALFMGLTVSAEEIIKDRKILKREAFLNLSRMSYLFSKLLILFGLSAIQTLTFVLIGNWILEINGMFFPFWMTLFSVSCFANVLGLNISSAFKSAVTVYILIPLLVIPQLILSGVVVNFDRLNPTITSSDKVPLIGDIMASRWAFEALAVAQFKDNEYERQFYPYDKVLTESEFKTSYVFPKIKDDLEFVHHLMGSQVEAEKKEIIHRLSTIKNEFNKELSKIGKDKFPDIEKLTIDAFDESVFENSMHFTDQLKNYYNLRFKSANEEKQAIMNSINGSEETRNVFIDLKRRNENEALAMLVKNMATKQRMLEHNNQLIRKIYPIYQDPEFPKNFFDFRAQFYQPRKHFAGQMIDTLYFNLIMIWMMTLILFVALYFTWLKKIVSGFQK